MCIEGYRGIGESQAIFRIRTRSTIHQKFPVYSPKFPCPRPQLVYTTKMPQVDNKLAWGLDTGQRTCYPTLGRFPRPHNARTLSTASYRQPAPCPPCVPPQFQPGRNRVGAGARRLLRRRRGYWGTRTHEGTVGDLPAWWSRCTVLGDRDHSGRLSEPTQVPRQWTRGMGPMVRHKSGQGSRASTPPPVHTLVWVGSTPTRSPDWLMAASANERTAQSWRSTKT